jgi:hypothetical protein
MKNAFDPSDENRLPAPLSPPSAAMGEGLGGEGFVTHRRSIFKGAMHETRIQPK